MLGLQCATSEEWIRSVNADPAAVLSDHAHCEKKAAMMAVSLINRYPEKHALVVAMAELAQEEMGHFAQVVAMLHSRGYELAYDAGDNYVQQLRTLVRTHEPVKLLDSLIVGSLIEARSCERFALLADSVEDNELREFYRSLLESEARHRSEFLKLARLYFDRSEVDLRLKQLSALEAEIILSLQHHPTMHG